MVNVINFNSLRELVNDYGGSEKKMKFIDDANGDIFMVKLPDPVREKNRDLSYMNNQYSEYVGSHIFELLGIPTQETVIGTYTDTKERVVVGCKDLSNSHYKLIEFAKYELSRNPDVVFSQSAERFIDTIYNDDRFDYKQTIERFWDMFVVDAFIMNGDRHFHNIGIFENCNTGALELSPVFDCGSCLGALLDDSYLLKVMSDETLFKNTVFNTYSAISYGGSRILNHSFLLKNIPDLNDAVIRVVPKMDISVINNMINDVPLMSDVRKEFYIKAIEFNYRNMMIPAFKQAITFKLSDDSTTDEAKSILEELRNRVLGDLSAAGCVQSMF